MKIYLGVTAGVLLSLSLVGCAPEPVIGTYGSTSPSQSASSTSGTPRPTTEVPSSYTPDAKASDIVRTGVQWDAYPGLKEKLDGRTAKSDCAGLREIQDGFKSSNDLALNKYISEALKLSSCSS